MTALSKLLDSFRNAAVTEREKGTYFEELTVWYLQNEPSYRDLYSDVWFYADWTNLYGQDNLVTGIDLVAKIHGANEFHAILCRLYAPDYQVMRSDIDSYLMALRNMPFTNWTIVTTTDHWSEHAKDLLLGQHPTVSKVDLTALEGSLVDWSKY
jgi:predicted helicase